MKNIVLLIGLMSLGTNCQNAGATMKNTDTQKIISSSKSHIFKVDKFIVPPSARDTFLKKVYETHNHLKGQPGFVQDFILEKSSGNGEFNLVTIVEWENSAAIEKAKQVIKELHRKAGFDPREFQKTLGVKSDLADYHETR